MRLLHPVLLSAIVLAGCGAATAKWEKSGATAAKADEDLQQCRMEARLSPEPLGTPLRRGMGAPMMEQMEERDARDAGLIQKCMQAKGYAAAR